MFVTGSCRELAERKFYTARSLGAFSGIYFGGNLSPSTPSTLLSLSLNRCPAILFQQRNMLRHSASRCHFLFFCLLPLLPLLLTWSPLLDPTAGLSPLPGVGRGSNRRHGLPGRGRRALAFPFTWVSFHKLEF